MSCLGADLDRHYPSLICLHSISILFPGAYNRYWRLLGRKVSADLYCMYLSWANLSIIARVRSPHALLWTTSRALKWSLLSAVVPRLGLTAFNFCQPFLLQRAIELSQQPITSASTNIGYGLIGAYFLVYTGIAVCSARHEPQVTTATKETVRSLPASSSISHIESLP